MSTIFKASLILTVFFGINKIVALARQAIIAKEFGFSAEIDAFNVANNLPDLLFSLISGGALAMAFIPVLAEYLHKQGQKESWRLFSIVSNLVFISTAVLSVVVAIFATELIRSPFGIAPGFSPDQQALAADLMIFNLIATLIFSISGLVMAGLQANKHFLIPAIAPILYNVGQIFGALFLVPYFGVYGLVYGVIIGAVLHLLIQVPMLFHYQFSWTPSLSLRDPGVRQTLRLMGPRILTVLCIQIMFLSRDNLASRLQEGSVTALTYAYFIMQVPETLIGTAIATALLPTLAEMATQDKKEAFTKLLNNSIAVVISITVLITVFMSISLDFLLKPIFGFESQQSTLLIWTTRAYLIGLLSNCLLEVTTRAFYAKQSAKIPLAATILRTILFILVAIFIVAPLGAIGLALADSIAITLEVVILMFLIKRTHSNFLELEGSLLRTIIATTVGVLIFYALTLLPYFNSMPLIIMPFIVGTSAALFFVRKELRLMLKL